MQGGEGAGLVSGLGVVAFARTERGVVLVEGVGNVFEENEFDEGMLVLTCAPMFHTVRAACGIRSRYARLRRVHDVAPVAFGWLR